MLSVSTNTPAIVYVTLQRTAEEVAERLVRAGFPARPYHAGMDDGQLDVSYYELSATHGGCQVAALGAHFTERRDKPCGHCTWCLGGKKPVRVPERTAPPIDPGVWRRAVAVRDEHPGVFRDPRALARFLCGVSSPALSRAKLTRNPLFGALAAVPFVDVHRQAAAERQGGANQ